MRYVVSKNDSLFGHSSRYGRMSVEKSLEILWKLDVISFDTETTGLDPFLSKIVCMQLGNKHIQILVDKATIEIEIYKALLESDKLFLVVYGKFDLKMLHNHRIVMRNVHDLSLAEEVLYLGYPRNFSTSLGALSQKYLGENMDKSFRANIGKEGLTERVIVYSCEDIAHLEDIKEAQDRELEKEDLLTACYAEDLFLVPLAYMEWCGVEMDEALWRKKVEEDKIEIQRIKKELEDAVIEWSLQNPHPNKVFYFDEYSMSDEERRIWKANNSQIGGKNKARSRLRRRSDLDKVQKIGNMEYKQIAYESTSRYPYIFNDGQLDMFSGEAAGYSCTINWGSSMQVIPLLEDLGCDVMVEDKNSPTGYRKSCDKKKIGPQRYKHRIIDLYTQYKIFEKIQSTYGLKFLDNRNPVTGRIHSDFRQLGADTTRLSSTKPNMQNLPSNGRTRSCFIAPKGWDFVSSDYSGQESVLMAEFSKDEMMLHEYLEGDKDMHSVFARAMFEEMVDKTTKEIKTKYVDYRREAKKHEFLIFYGGNDHTFMKNFGYTKEKSRKLYMDIREKLKGLMAWQDLQKRLVWQRGYILISELTGHKAHIYDYEELMEMKEELENGGWDLYRSIPSDSNGRKKPRNEVEARIVDIKERYTKRKAESEKQALDYSIQGTGAQLVKLAYVKLFNEVCKRNWLYDKVRFCIQVHDNPITLSCLNSVNCWNILKTQKLQVA